MRFAAAIPQEHAPVRSALPVRRPVSDELTRGAQPSAPRPQKVPDGLDPDQLVRLVGEW